MFNNKKCGFNAELKLITRYIKDNTSKLKIWESIISPLFEVLSKGQVQTDTYQGSNANLHVPIVMFRINNMPNNNVNCHGSVHYKLLELYFEFYGHLSLICFSCCNQFGLSSLHTGRDWYDPERHVNFIQYIQILRFNLLLKSP